MTVKFYAAQDARFEINEQRQFDRLKSIMLKHFDSPEDEYWVIVSHLIGGTDFDMIVLKRDAIIALEMKNYSGKVIGGENGKWVIENDNGDCIDIKGTHTTPNPFQQAARQRRSLRNHFNKILPELFSRFQDSEPIEYVTSVVCFADGSNFDFTELPKNALWFRLIQENELVKTLRSINSKDQYGFQPSEVETILKKLRVEPDTHWTSRTDHSGNGTNTTQRDRFIDARDKYKPDPVKFLIVAESPPASGGYFYFDFATRHDYLFKETMKALGIIPETMDIGEGFNKVPFLRQFQSKGFFVIDVVYTAIGELSESEKKQVISDGLPGLEGEIKSLNPERIIIVKDFIFDKVSNRLIALGFRDRILNQGPIPFPSHGQPVRFRKMFRELVAPVEPSTCASGSESSMRELDEGDRIGDEDELEPITDSRDDEVGNRVKKSRPSDEIRADDELSHVEITLRDLIAASLERKYGSSWYKKGVPEDVKTYIEKTVDKDTSKYPYKTAELKSDPSLFLQYTNITNLERIITWENNWGEFADIFRNANETKRRAEQLQNYRNHVRHHRRQDEIVVNDGKAAILWFLKCMECR